MFKVSSKAGRYWYLDHVNWEEKRETEHSSVYHLVEINGKIRPIYFWKFEDFWIESPCILAKTTCTEEQLEELVSKTFCEEYFESALSFAKSTYRDGIFYQIEAIQCSPFLPEEMTFLQVMSESECLDWMLENDYWN